jgi:hypothetical protein
LHAVIKGVKSGVEERPSESVCELLPLLCLVSSRSDSEVAKQRENVSAVAVTRIKSIPGELCGWVAEKVLWWGGSLSDKPRAYQSSCLLQNPAQSTFHVDFTSYHSHTKNTGQSRPREDFDLKFEQNGSLVGDHVRRKRITVTSSFIWSICELHAHLTITSIQDTHSILGESLGLSVCHHMSLSSDTVAPGSPPPTLTQLHVILCLHLHSESPTPPHRYSEHSPTSLHVGRTSQKSHHLGSSGRAVYKCVFSSATTLFSSPPSASLLFEGCGPFCRSGITLFE